MKRARQERLSSSSDFNGYGSLTSPRRVMIPLLVRDGKPCPSGANSTSPLQNSSVSDMYGSSASNSRTGLPYSDELSLYTSPTHAAAISPFTGPLGAGGFSMAYSSDTSSQFAASTAQQTRDYLTATYHHQIGPQQYGAAYGASHLRGAAAAAFSSPYALPASSYSAGYSQHQACWPSW